MWMPITVIILSAVGIALCFLSRRRSVSYTNEEMEHLASTCQFYDPVEDTCRLCVCLNVKNSADLSESCSYIALHDSSRCPIIHPEFTHVSWNDLLDLWLDYSGALSEK